MPAPTEVSGSFSMETTQTQTQTEAVEHPGAIDTFGLKTDVFIAQLVNFLIILFVLWRWAYKPLLKLMEARQERIEKGLHDAETVSLRLADIEKDHQAALSEARKQSAEFMKEAHAEVEKKRDEILNKSREEVGKLITEARKKIAEERSLAEAELKREISALVVATAEMVLKEKLDPTKDAQLMDVAVKKAPQHKK